MIKANEDWRKRLSELAEGANLNGKQLADKMKVSRATAYHWLAGTRIPSRTNQPKLAKVLRTSVAGLNGWES